VAEPATIARALAHARTLGVDRLDAQLLLAHQLGRSRAWLLAHDDAELADADRSALDALLARRVAGEPLAYLVGEREFRGLSLRVTCDVLVPRPETETLVDWALELLAGVEAPRVADLGTGSGAIALALKHACPGAQVHASDASDAALAVARDNGQRLGLSVAWHHGDWWRAFGKLDRFDLALANPPYIAAGDPHLGALRYEPREALVAGSGPAGNGLADLQRIVSGASGHLNAGAWLLLEHGFEQADAVRDCLRCAGFDLISTRIDLAGQPRISGGRLGDPLD
jgi:release factor glutamine methyltransferase